MHQSKLMAGAALVLAMASQAWAEETAADSGKRVLPKLSINWQCSKDCTINDKVPDLLASAYAGAAAKNGFTVSETDVAEVNIVDYRQRPPGARVMMGAFAGKDRLTVKIRYRGKEVEAGDSVLNALQGMNHLCESVGQRSYKAIAELARRG